MYLYIGGVDNTTNKIISNKIYKWKDAPSRAQQIIFQNDILFSTVRTYLKNIAIVESKNYDGQIASSGFTVIRANEKVATAKFLFYYSLSRSFLQPLNELQTGSSYPAVRDKDVFAQLTPLPPLPEQHLIVAKIEMLFSELDKGTESLKTAALSFDHQSSCRQTCQRTVRRAARQLGDRSPGHPATHARR